MMVIAEGARIFELSCLVHALEPLIVCNCGNGKLTLKEDLEESDGLYSSLYLVCEACSYKLHVPTSRYIGQQTSNQCWEVNQCTNTLIAQLNVQLETLKSILNTFNVPYFNKSCEDVRSANFVYQPPPTTKDKEVDLSECEPEIEDNINAEFLELTEPISNTIDLKDKSESPVTHSTGSTIIGDCYSCIMCNQSFECSATLKEHTHQHSKDLTFPKCSESLNAQRQVKSQSEFPSKSHHQCSVCGKAFKKMYNLTQHVRTHTGEKPFLCSTCGKSFGDASTLSKHRKAMHTSERPLRCESCGKSFYHMGHLKVHLRKHTGEKPFSCTTCGKTFAYQNSLKKHMALHSAHKQYQCSECIRCFRWRESLKQHMKTHQQKQDSIWQQQPIPSSILATKSATLSAPIAETNPDMVSLSHVIPYLETIRVEYL